MSVWGKIIGGVGGFAIGGPIGALIGAVAGHAVDKARGQGEEPEDATKSVAFTIATIALGAKMAKADGRVTRDEVDAFKRVFRVPPEEVTQVSKFFDQARKDSRGFEPYARQVAGMFADNPAVLEELLYCLSVIAKADSVVHPAEVTYLRSVSNIFGLDDHAFERIKRPRYMSSFWLAPRAKSLGCTQKSRASTSRANVGFSPSPPRDFASGMLAKFYRIKGHLRARIASSFHLL